MPNGEITRLIERWQKGEKAAENDLFEALYHHLYKMAVQCMRAERANQSISATVLVHEAYLRFRRAQRLEIADRSHFLALAARVMRRILVDRARARRAQKRERDPAPAEQAEALVSTDADAVQILSVDRALTDLAKQSTRMAQLVELRFFAGYSLEESALVLGLSERQLRRDWQAARTRLRIAIDGTPGPAL